MYSCFVVPIYSLRLPHVGIMFIFICQLWCFIFTSPERYRCGALSTVHGVSMESVTRYGSVVDTIIALMESVIWQVSVQTNYFHRRRLARTLVNVVLRDKRRSRGEGEIRGAMGPWFMRTTRDVWRDRRRRSRREGPTARRRRENGARVSSMGEFTRGPFLVS